uniref:Uncharacterized protein n=1 Tax=Cacopsylla melanoneura TaxID=428564 RepID=A0A8D8R7L3_9HEMI
MLVSPLFPLYTSLNLFIHELLFLSQVYPLPLTCSHLPYISRAFSQAFVASRAIREIIYMLCRLVWLEDVKPHTTSSSSQRLKMIQWLPSISCLFLIGREQDPHKRKVMFRLE